MTDLRKAAEMALESMDKTNRFVRHYAHSKHTARLADEFEEAKLALRQALEQPKPDWTTDKPVPPFKYLDFPEYKITPPEQSPVAMVTGYKSGHCVIAPIGGNTIFQTGLALYTAPTKQWVGLTAGEMSDIWCETTGRDWVNEDTHVYGEAIEAKLKEKNNG